MIGESELFSGELILYSTTCVPVEFDWATEEIPRHAGEESMLFGLYPG